MGTLDPFSPHDMKYRFSTCQQVVSNNSAMPAQPNSLRAHDSGRHLVPEINQLSECQSKILAHRVVSVIVETLVLPESIHGWWNVPSRSSQSPQRRKRAIASV